jgi:hypothetical protein
MSRFSSLVAQDQLGDIPLIDCCEWLPHDLADTTTRDLRVIDSVISQDTFSCTVSAVVKAAFNCNKVIIGSRRGVHRAPVVATCAREILMSLGFSVEVLEFELVQPDLLGAMTYVAEDMRSTIKVCPIAHNA